MKYVEAVNKYIVQKLVLKFVCVSSECIAVGGLS